MDRLLGVGISDGLNELGLIGVGISDGLVGIGDDATNFFSDSIPDSRL